MDSSLLDLLATAFHEVQTIRYAELASSMIILYDHLITLDQEITLIWPASWSLGKCLFLVNRYYALFVVIFNNYSIQWFRWQGGTGVVMFILGELILQLRLYALYYLNKPVLATMALMFTVAVAASATLMGQALMAVTANSHMIPGLTFCIPVNLPSDFYAFWIPMLSSETLLCGLALFRGIQNFRQKRTMNDAGRQLFETLIRDSFLYFAILFAIYLANTVIFIAGNPAQLESAIGYSVAFSCVMANRLCLNVRSMLSADDHIVSGQYSQPRAGAVLPPRSHRPTQSSGQQTRSRQTIVLVGDPNVGFDVISDYELYELRQMRAGRVIRV